MRACGGLARSDLRPGGTRDRLGIAGVLGEHLLEDLGGDVELPGVERLLRLLDADLGRTRPDGAGDALDETP